MHIMVLIFYILFNLSSRLIGLEFASWDPGNADQDKPILGSRLQ